MVINMQWNIILIVYAQVTATMIKLSDCRPLGPKWIMFYQGSVTCYDSFHFVCFVFLFGCMIFPFVMAVLMFKTKREGGMGWLRRVYPSLVLQYRTDAWWYGSFNLFRRFIVIAVSSAPTSEPEVTATFLAIVVGLIFGFHLLVQPMHFNINNLGETYVWFIALCLATINIINFEELPDNYVLLLEVNMTILVYGLFFPMPYLLISFIQGKMPFEFEYSQKQDDFDDLDYSIDSYGMPNSVMHGNAVDAKSGGSSIDAMSPQPRNTSIESPIPGTPGDPELDDNALDHLIDALPGGPDTIVSNAEMEKKENEGKETRESEDEKPFEKTIELPFQYQLHIKKKPKPDEQKEIKFGKFKKKKKLIDPMKQIQKELNSWLPPDEEPVQRNTVLTDYADYEVSKTRTVSSLTFPDEEPKRIRRVTFADEFEESDSTYSRSSSSLQRHQSVADLVAENRTSLFANDYIIEEEMTDEALGVEHLRVNVNVNNDGYESYGVESDEEAVSEFSPSNLEMMESAWNSYEKDSSEYNE